MFSGAERARWRLVSPAPLSAALEIAGAVPRVRRGVLAQVRAHESIAVYRGDLLIAVAMFARHGWRREELALGISPAAAPHMLTFVRIAQLTLARLGQDRLIVASVDPGNPAGRRMAQMIGFRPARLKSRSLWVLRRHHDIIVHGRRIG